MGARDEGARIRRYATEQGLAGAANDGRWARLIESLRELEGGLAYRVETLDASAGDWERDLYHLPSPRGWIRWLDLSTHAYCHRGVLVAPEAIDRTAPLLAAVRAARLPFDHVGQVVRIHGYLPRTLERLVPPFGPA